MNRGMVALGASILAAWISGGSLAKGEEVRYSKQTYVYKTVGDCQIKADAYRLPGDEVRPVILWIHGGALITGRRDFVPKDQLARYLEAGFALVSIDYRLAPETKVKGIIEDLQDAYAWLRTEGPRRLKIDPDRVAVIGHSARTSAAGSTSTAASTAFGPRKSPGSTRTRSPARSIPTAPSAT